MMQELNSNCDFTLDCRGMNCPMPIVALTRAARDLGPGKLIDVTASDLAFRPDVEAWARRTGHTIQNFQEDGNEQRAIILINSSTV